MKNYIRLFLMLITSLLLTSVVNAKEIGKIELSDGKVITYSEAEGYKLSNTNYIDPQTCLKARNDYENDFTSKTRSQECFFGTAEINNDGVVRKKIGYFYLICKKENIKCDISALKVVSNKNNNLLGNTNSDDVAFKGILDALLEKIKLKKAEKSNADYEKFLNDAIDYVDKLGEKEIYKNDSNTKAMISYLQTGLNEIKTDFDKNKNKDNIYKLLCDLGSCDKTYVSDNTNNNVVTNTGSNNEYNWTNYVLSKNDAKCANANSVNQSDYKFFMIRSYKDDIRFTEVIKYGNSCTVYSDTKQSKVKNCLEHNSFKEMLDPRKITEDGFNSEGRYSFGTLIYRIWRQDFQSFEENGKSDFLGKFFIPPYLEFVYSAFNINAYYGDGGNLNGNGSGGIKPYCSCKDPSSVITYWRGPVKPNEDFANVTNKTKENITSYFKNSYSKLQVCSNGGTILFQDRINKINEISGWWYVDMFVNNSDPNCVVGGVINEDGTKPDVLDSGIKMGMSFVLKKENLEKYTQWYNNMKWEDNGDPAYDCKY